MSWKDYTPPPELPDDDVPLWCDRCQRELHPGKGDFYVVRIEAFADPTPPSFSEEDLQRDLRREIRSLLEELRSYSAQELMEQVYRRVILYLCTSCYREWIEHPVG
jgi:hypothetical protein